MTGNVLSGVYFSSSILGVEGYSNATLFQRNAINPINSSPSSAVNIGNLVADKTQLTALGAVIGSNPTDYYSFNLTGKSFAAQFSNTNNLDYQISNSAGTVIADNNGTTAQQLAFSQMTAPGGLTAVSGKYTIKVTYGPTSQKGTQQDYRIQLYSGSTFSAAYETTAAAQANLSQNVTADNTLTFSTADAGLFTTTKYNKINAQISSAINIGWLVADKTSLKVLSQTTVADNTNYYKFSFVSGSSLKLAFNNKTNTSPLQVQLYDSSGLHVLADNYGTKDQVAAFNALNSPDGLSAQHGSYIVKVFYGPGTTSKQTQTYNFQVSSGSSYSALDQTTAPAQSVMNAILSGNYTSGYNSKTASASYVNSLLPNSLPISTNPGIYRKT